MAKSTESDAKRHPKKAAMLEALAHSGNVSKAAELAGVNRATHYKWIREDSEYATAADDAMETAADLLEEEARRRAHDGVDEPVFYQGVQCGTVRKYSDTLLIFLLKAARPNKFRERASFVVEDPTKALAKMLGVVPEEIPA